MKSPLPSRTLAVLAPAALALLGACAATPNPEVELAQDYIYVAPNYPPGYLPRPVPASGEQDPRYVQGQPMRIERHRVSDRELDRRAHRDSSPRLSLSLGQRSLDNDYKPAEDQIAFGIGLSQQTPGSALGWEFGLLGSYDEDPAAGFDIKSSTLEVYGGVRSTLARDDSPVRPYIGAGGALITAYYEGLGTDDSDSSPAVYAHAGVEIEVSQVMAVGIDLRGLFGSDIELFGVNSDADYTQLTVFLSLLL